MVILIPYYSKSCRHQIYFMFFKLKLSCQSPRIDLQITFIVKNQTKLKQVKYCCSNSCLFVIQNDSKLINHCQGGLIKVFSFCLQKASQSVSTCPFIRTESVGVIWTLTHQSMRAQTEEQTSACRAYGQLQSTTLQAPFPVTNTHYYLII